MNSKTFVNILFEKNFDLKQIEKNVDSIKPEIEKFLDKNSVLINNVSPSKVAKFLIETCIQLSKKGISQEIISNVYLYDSVVFAILSCQYDINLQKKLVKVFYNIHLNTNHYTIEVKNSLKHSRTTILAPKGPIEIFWIIPFFVNIPILLKNLSEYILSCIDIYAKKGIEFYEGYKYFNDNITSFDKNNFKTFMREASN